jgi:hypothetical protein
MSHPEPEPQYGRLVFVTDKTSNPVVSNRPAIANIASMMSLVSRGCAVDSSRRFCPLDFLANRLDLLRFAEKHLRADSPAM